ncbi:MAG: hypothetical protein NPIRA04_03320 [Nitrospirales bacterium]|nr:MAG: hypothetical protein NPIRA04_03320 [Nitrospirales bacterium]
MNQQHASISSNSSFCPTRVISKLMALWYRTIGLEHHKDHDCHFTIETRFSYGGQVRFVLNHHGYLEKDIEEEYWSYELAEQALIRLLRQLIRKHCQIHSTLDQDVEDADLDRCNEILEELGDLQVKNERIGTMP